MCKYTEVTTLQQKVHFAIEKDPPTNAYQYCGYLFIGFLLRTLENENLKLSKYTCETENFIFYIMKGQMKHSIASKFLGLKKLYFGW